MTGVRFPQGTPNKMKYYKNEFGVVISSTRNTTIISYEYVRIVDFMYDCGSRLDEAPGVQWDDSYRWISTELDR